MFEEGQPTCAAHGGPGDLAAELLGSRLHRSLGAVDAVPVHVSPHLPCGPAPSAPRTATPQHTREATCGHRAGAGQIRPRRSSRSNSVPYIIRDPSVVCVAKASAMARPRPGLAPRTGPFSCGTHLIRRRGSARHLARAACPDRHSAVAIPLPLRGCFLGQSAVFRGFQVVTENYGDSVEVSRISMVTPGGYAVPTEEFLSAPLVGEAVV